MPRWRNRRPLKRWRYVGVYGPELMICVGDAHVGGLPQHWWAVALPHGTLVERTTSGRGGGSMGHDRGAVGPMIQLALERAGEPIEVVSEHGRSYIWTRK